MNARLKYITLRVGGMRLAILLHEAITHSQALNRMEAKPISAGFCQITDAGVTVETEGSVSLNLCPKPGDAQIIEETLMLMGMRPLLPTTMRRQYLRA